MNIDDYTVENQMTWSNLDTWYGKMFLEHSQATKEKTSEPSLKKPHGSQTKMPQFLDLRGNGNLLGVSWETDIRLLGEYMMPNIGEYRNEENAYVWLLTSTGTQHQRYCLNLSEKPMKENPTKLSEILEEDANPKYYLSAKACQGILNRASRRGKQLPDILESALRNQVGADE